MHSTRAYLSVSRSHDHGGGNGTYALLLGITADSLGAGSVELPLLGLEHWLWHATEELETWGDAFVDMTSDPRAVLDLELASCWHLVVDRCWRGSGCGSEGACDGEDRCEEHCVVCD